ncbi:MAG: hypothetical protein Q8L15_21280 [Methylobacter sp.]|nr:hypothetical protein [Methylobacter sp.]
MSVATGHFAQGAVEQQVRQTRALFGVKAAPMLVGADHLPGFQAVNCSQALFQITT